MHEADEPEPSPGRRALSAGAAVVPGALVHGAGHYVLGQPKTAKRLLLAEGVGVGMTLTGGVTLFATGASRYVVGPAAAISVLGLGLFMTSFAADLYGVLSPDAGAAGKRRAFAPWVEGEIGYRHVYDPQFEYRHFLVQSASLRLGHWRATPSGWFSTEGDNARYRLEGAYRFLGAMPGRETKHGLSALDVVAAGTRHTYDPSSFGIWTAEVAVHARYDLGNVGPTLRGAFVEGGLGYAHQWITYDVPGVDVPSDDEMLLLARLGFGVALRGRAAAGSEILAYYDHRHDDYAAGLLMPGIPSGVAGHFGVAGRWYFNKDVGVSVDGQVGSAVVAGASFLVRQ